MSITSKLVVSGILAILVVALGTYSIVQANAQTREQQIQQKFKEIEHCKELSVAYCREIKGSMAPDELANSAQWKNSNCEGLLKSVGL